MSSSSDSTITIDSSEEARLRSPLWMVSQEPLLNDLVSYLGAIKDALQSKPKATCRMKFSRAHLRDVRAAFDRMIRRGEEGLHRLCELFCHSFVGTYQSQSVVIGEVSTTGERFTLSQPLSTADLYSTMDLDLGTRQLRKLQYFDGIRWVAPTLVANVVEYQPTQTNPFGVQKLISRIKAEEELWNKVVDEIFGLDALVKRDKELRHLSKYVKDVFGIKIVVNSTDDATALHNKLQSHSWTEQELRAFGIVSHEVANNLVFVETKNYVTDHDKESGWEAIKSVVKWNGRVFEIQLQSLSNYWREREFLTRESHAGFKNRREQVRQQVAAHLPLFGFYQDLLKWLFQDPDGPAPIFPGVTVALVD
jgi:ppGpp synthetase/RelA/SpoT-type nucleotidyltranferase